MNAVKKQVQELVKVELEAANKKFSQFRSRHEDEWRGLHKEE